MDWNGRVPRTIQILLGLAASAGLAICLGGQVWAADGTAAVAAPNEGGVVASLSDAPSPMTDLGPDVPVVKAQTLPEEVVKKDPVVNQVQSKLETVVASGTEAPVGEVTAKTVPPVASTKLEEQPAPVTPNRQDDVTAAVQPVAGTVSSKSPVAKAVGGQERPAFSAAGPSVVVDVPVAPAAVQAATVGDVAGQMAVEVQRMVLPIQPIISGEMTMIAGLSLLPRPVVPEKPVQGPMAPVAVGLLGDLTQSIAGTVVPALVNVAADWVLDRQLDMRSGPVALMLMVVLSLLGIGTLFTVWLRRAGFVGAARSDVAALVNFATPIKGYVEGIFQHNPFFMTSEIKAYQFWDRQEAV